jgi:hypothetical protein
MTDGGVNLSYKDVTDGWMVGFIHELSDVTDRYSLEYARICSNISLIDGQEPYRT